MSLAVVASSLVVVVPGGASPAGRTPHGAGPTSTYHDPCEHTPRTDGRSAADLRELVVDDLFGPDGRTVSSEPVGVELRLCRALGSADAVPLRVDLHPRIDTAGGEDTDYAEDATRWLVFSPPRAPGTEWTWQLHERTGSGSRVVDQGPVQQQGDGGDTVTSLRAEVPADQIRAAGDPDTNSTSGLPPLALRSCTADVDCGPGYELDGDENVITDDTGRPDVDYLPDPRHLPVTYPSVCQLGPAPAANETRRGPARHAPAQVVVDAATARKLEGRGWHLLNRLHDGRTTFRGTPEAVRAVVPRATVGTVGLRRPSVEPSDPYFGPDGDGAPTGQWSLRRLGAPRAWDRTTGDPDVLVAVLDSGFDGRHPDLEGRAVAGRDYVETRTSETSRPLDVTGDTDLGGHGTFIASTIAASTHDTVGMAGLGWQTRVLVARVFDAESCAADASLVEAMHWAVDQGAAAINLSLGGPQPSGMLLQAGESVVAAGVIPVAAAGNGGRSSIDYPAYYEPYVSVAATGYVEPESSSQDPIASYSAHNDGVDLAAPGGSANGDDSRGLLGACWQDAEVVRGYCRLAGTSFATPLVAATIALARTLDPARTVTGMRELLADTALDLTDCSGCTSGYDEASGHGRLRTDEAVDWLAMRSENLRVVGPDSDPIAGANATSRATFAGGSADRALLSRDDVFADALAGAALAGSAGPILLTPSQRLDGRTAAELVRVLPRGSTVTLLGGPVALSERVEEDVQALGYATERVWGPTRIETAVEIADRVSGGRASQVLVASAANWPDAVAGGAYAAARQVPLLLTWPDSAGPERSPRFLDTLASYGPQDVVILGGPVAVHDDTAAQIEQRVPGTTRRVAGATRNETAARIVTQLWQRTTATGGDRFGFIDGWRTDGWAYGLSASPTAARGAAPMLLVRAGLEFDEPTTLLRDTLAYRLPTAAGGTFFGPLDADASTRSFTLDRLGELLGG